MPDVWVEPKFIWMNCQADLLWCGPSFHRVNLLFRGAALGLGPR